MNKNYTHVVMLLDRSQSMAGCWDETILGVDSFIEKQKREEGKMTFSLYTFNDKLTKVLDFIDVRSVGDSRYYANPQGWTALYDAFCIAVDETGNRLAGLPERDRPYKILFVVMTDGAENHSSMYNLNAVKERVDRQQNVYSWNFLFLGADFDTQEQVNSTGIKKDNSVRFAKEKVLSFMNNFACSVVSYRSSESGRVYDSASLKSSDDKVNFTV